MTPPAAPATHDGDDAEITFRPLTRGDFGLLSEWTAAPHVERWWQEGTAPHQIEERYGPIVDGTDPTEVFIVHLGSRAVGLVQRYALDDNPDWKTSLVPTGTPGDAFSIDYFIGTGDLIGRGIGGRLIEQFVGESWDRYPDCPGCVVAVHQDNRRSWRALEKAGFVRAWSGMIESEDPSDAGPQYVYLHPPPVGPGRSSPV